MHIYTIESFTTTVGLCHYGSEQVNVQEQSVRMLVISIWHKGSVCPIARVQNKRNDAFFHDFSFSPQWKDCTRSPGLKYTNS